jgi:hypothetical protein
VIIVADASAWRRIVGGAPGSAKAGARTRTFAKLHSADARSFAGTDSCMEDSQINRLARVAAGLFRIVL